jgi:hypothetical protein
MMKKETVVSVFPYNGTQYLNGVAFDPAKNKGIEATIFAALKRYGKKKHVSINTYDVVGKQADVYVYFDMPYPWNLRVWREIIAHTSKNVLICNESSLIIPFNYWKILHRFFVKVYTWYEPFIDNKKYFRIRLPKSSVGTERKPLPFQKKKFLAIINKNTLPFAPFRLLWSFGKELYSDRIQAVEFFEKVLPSEFYFFGRGWNKPKKYNISERLFGFRYYPSYKGEVDDKQKLLSTFKFSICFENLTDVDGYVTEKIVDCLKAKCVPIYWGASDITKYIPKDCFIDYRQFGSYNKLLAYLLSIDKRTYDRYVRNIEALISDKTFRKQWFEDGFAEFFYKDIIRL